jgi:hypothetical protein
MPTIIEVNLVTGEQIEREMTPDEIIASTPVPPTPEQILVQQLAEAQAYLERTDFYYPRFLETGEPVPTDVVQKRIEARELIRANTDS